MSCDKIVKQSLQASSKPSFGGSGSGGSLRSLSDRESRSGSRTNGSSSGAIMDNTSDLAGERSRRGRGRIGDESRESEDELLVSESDDDLDGALSRCLLEAAGDERSRRRRREAGDGGRGGGGAGAVVGNGGSLVDVVGQKFPHQGGHMYGVP